MIARDHHYLFSHTHLRNQALRDPQKVVGELSGPMRESFLFFLWEQVEGVASTKVDAAGLGVEGVDRVGAGTIALVRMPPPQHPTESLYAAIWMGPAGARYFVFDRSASDPGQGNLAELERDETRVSLGLLPATKEALLDALVKELTGPASQPPIGVAPTAMMPSFPGVALSPAPSMPGGPMPGGALPPPGAMAAPPAKKKRSALWWLLAIPLVAPLFCCLGVAFMGWESGLADDADFEVATELSIAESDAERLVITVTGPEEISSYAIEGPGADGCGYLYARYGDRQVRCEVDLSAIADPTPSYHVTAHGRADRFFGEPVEDGRVLEQDVEVTRRVALEWSDAAQGTVIRGFPGRLQVTRDGFLRLSGAPAGATLIVGPDSNADAEPLIGLDIAALTNQVGVTAVLRDGGRINVDGVTVRLADGTLAAGSIQLNAADLGPALTSQFALLGDGHLGEAGGEAALWIEDGRVRQIVGAPRTVSDVGRVVVIENREARSGTCGPYALYGIGWGERIARMRWMADVTAYDRVEQRRIARRSFRGSRPDCPYSIQQGTRAIHGPRDAGADADEYARRYLVPDAES